MSNQRPLSTIVLRNMMMEVMKDTEFCRGITGRYDFMSTGGAHQDNLFALVEEYAIHKGLIEEEIPVSKMAWGGPRYMMHEGSTTNFFYAEINSLWEAFALLLDNHILAPGCYGSSPNLPYFHITTHGIECINAVDILPYDIDGYLKKLKETPDIDEWVLFYMEEALRCFNANCYNAAVAMIGLSSEVMIERLIKELSRLLGKATEYGLTPKKDWKQAIDSNGKTIKEYFDTLILKDERISKKYDVINEALKYVDNIPRGLTDTMDKPARDSFVTFIRLNRNEVSHCMDVKKDATETLLIFISFTKYCSLMTKMINEAKRLNN